jgi:tetratricopeptide (TPR) repeat protein
MTKKHTLIVAMLLASFAIPAFAQSAAEDNFIKKRFSAARDAARKSSAIEDIGILGWSQFMLDDYGAAGQSFRKLESQWSSDFDAIFGQAWVAIKTGRYADAEKFLDRTEGRAAGWQAYMILDAKAWLAMKKGDLAAAEKYFVEESRSQSGSGKPDAHVGLGWLWLNRGELNKAKTAFETGISLDDKCFFCRDGLARIALMKNDAKEALNQTLAGIAVTADNNGLNFLLPVVLAANNDAALSVRTYQNLLQKNPRSAVYRVGLGYSRLAAGNVDDARNEFQTVLKAEPGNVSAQGGLAALQIYKTGIVKDGWAAYYKGDLDEALKQFETRKAEAAAKKNPSAEDGLGWTLLAQGKPAEARNAFRAAIALDPEFFYSANGRIAAERAMLGTYQQAWGLLDLGRHDEATALFTKAKSDTPADLQWLIDDGLAWVAYYRKQYDVAEKAFSAILSVNKDAYLSEMGLGWVALEKKDYSAANRRITQSLLKNPYQALTAYTVPAQKLVDAGQFKDARELLTQGERVYPYSADIQYLMGRAKAGLNDDAGAGGNMTVAAQLAPLYIDPAFDKVKLGVNARQGALLALAWGLYYAGDPAAAVKRFEQYAAAGGNDVGAVTGRGWSLLAQKKLPEATAAFRSAQQKGAGADAEAGLGWTSLNGEKLADAEKSFKAALKATPFHASAQSGLAALQYRKTTLVKDGWESYYKGDYSKALAAFDSRRDEASRAGNPAAEDGRGWTLLARGEVKAALAAFDAALKIDANYFASQSGRIAAGRTDLVHYQRAWASLDAGKYAEARTAFTTARAETTPEFAWLVEDGLAWTSFYEKDIDGADKAFAAVVAKTPGAYLSQKGLGYVAVERKQFPAALKFLTTSYSRAPYQGIAAYTVPAAKMIEQSAMSEAKDVLALGAMAYPYSADIQYLTARALAGLQDGKGAAKAAAAAAALAPVAIDPAFDKLQLPPAASREGLANLGWGLYFAGDNAKAIKRFDQALQAGATDPNVSRGKAFALFRQAKYAEALPLLEAAAKLEPKTLLPVVETVPIPGTSQSWTLEYSAATTLAWTFYRMGDAARADKMFEDALNANPLSIDALTGRGYARLALKDKSGANRYFEQALQISPAYPDARRGLEAAGKT